MRNITVIFLCCLLLVVLQCKKEDAPSPVGPEVTGDYFGQTPPGENPEVFAEDFLKVEGSGFQNSSFSPDGKEFLYNVFRKILLTLYTKPITLTIPEQSLI